MGIQESVTSFMTVPISQVPEDYWMWEIFLNENPVKTIIELGTGNGGFSLFLGMQAYQRGAGFVTVDHQCFAHFDVGLAALLKLQTAFVHLNLRDDGFAWLGEFLGHAPHPVVLYCDDGNKPWEVSTFGPLLSKDDYLAVHDYGTEFQASDMTLNAAPVMAVLCERWGSWTRFYKVN